MLDPTILLALSRAHPRRSRRSSCSSGGAFAGAREQPRSPSPAGRPGRRGRGRLRGGLPGRAFAGGLIADEGAAFAKVAIYAASAVAIPLGDRWLARRGAARFEYPVLIDPGRARHGHDGLGRRPDLALCRHRAAVPGPLRPGRLPPRRRQGLRGGPEVFRAGRAVLGPAALRRLADLRLRRLDPLRRHRRRGAIGRRHRACSSAWCS